MGRPATISKFDVINARDALRAADKPCGIIAIRKHLGRGSPGLIGRLLREDIDARVPTSSKKSDARARRGARPTVEHVVDALALRDEETTELRQQVIQLEQRVASAEAKYAAVNAALNAKDQEIVQQREMFERWRTDLLRDRTLLANPVEQVTVTISAPTPARSTGKTHSGEQLDLYASEGATR